MKHKIFLLAFCSFLTKDDKRSIKSPIALFLIAKYLHQKSVI